MIVRNVGVARREESTIASSPVEEARLVVLGLDLLLGGDDEVELPQIEELAKGSVGSRGVERKPRRTHVVVDELAAVRPDERRNADERRLDA